MKQAIVTDPSQSARLQACGVDPKSADFVWMEDNPPRLTLRTEIIEDGNPYIIAPAWSLDKLLSILPRNVRLDDKHSFHFYLYPWHDGWQIDYHFVADDECHCLSCKYGKTPIEACVKMVEALKTNGYKLNEIKQCPDS